MKKKQLRNKDIKELIYVLDEMFGQGDLIDKNDKVELLDEKYISVNGEIMFFYDSDKLIPTLRMLLKRQFLPEIVVDMGAIKFVANGADIMRPGIVDVGDFVSDAYVCVVDVNNKKPLAVGIALFSSEEMMNQDAGKVIKNIHFVGDDVWNIG